MKIEILGAGCKKCQKQFDAAEDAVRLAGVQAEVVKVEALDDILDRGVMLTPAVVLDGKVLCSGKILPAKKIAALLATAAKSDADA